MTIITVTREGKVEVLANPAFQVSAHHDISCGFRCLFVILLASAAVAFIVIVVVIFFIFVVVSKDGVAILLLELVSAGRHILVKLLFIVAQLDIETFAFAFRVSSRAKS